MRLINTRTLTLHDFVGRRPPPYAILSHTWGSRELTLQDFHDHELRQRLPGFAKVEATCRQARKEGLAYAWVDSCCIDKTSSSELGESINSMFKWYRDAAVCYAFLEDVATGDVPAYTPPKSLAVLGPEGRSTTTSIGFGRSRWFTRGWTLQELIAPRRVDFYNREWEMIGEKRTMSASLAKTTGIDSFILDGTADLQQVSVGRRMSWAANRETAREEDMAYSLLGLFDAHIPLIYGEGGTRAFVRLQEKILEQTDDHTIFAWRGTSLTDGGALPNDEARGLFATSPNDFQNFLSEPRLLDLKKRTETKGNIPTDNLARIWGSKMPQDPITKTNKGIQITSKIKDLRYPWATGDLIVLLLNCNFNGDPRAAAGIYLKHRGENHYVRIRASELAVVHPESTHVVATVYGLGSIEGNRHHHFDDQWTTSRRILGEMAEAGRLGGDCESALVKEGYADAVQIPRRSFNLYGLLGSFYLDRIWTVDAQGLWRAFLFNPRDHAGDLVLRTHDRFKTALVFTSRTSKENIFIFLGTREASDEDGNSSGGRIHYVNATCLSAEKAAHLHSRFIRKGFRTEQARTIMRAGKAPRQSLTFRVSGGQSLMKVAIKPTTMYGIPMQRLRISWASLLRDAAQFSIRGPAIIAYLSAALWLLYVMLVGPPKDERVLDLFIPEFAKGGLLHRHHVDKETLLHQDNVAQDSEAGKNTTEGVKTTTKLFSPLPEP